MTSHRQSTNWRKEKKKKKNEKCEKIFKTQNAEDSKCFKCVAWSALFITKQAVITSKSFHHFAKVSSLLDAARDLDDASSRWRELSCRTSPWSRDEWDIRHIFHQIDISSIVCLHENSVRSSQTVSHSKELINCSRSQRLNRSSKSQFDSFSKQSRLIFNLW